MNVYANDYTACVLCACASHLCNLVEDFVPYTIIGKLFGIRFSVCEKFFRRFYFSFQILLGALPLYVHIDLTLTIAAAAADYYYYYCDYFVHSFIHPILAAGSVLSTSSSSSSLILFSFHI